MTFRVSPCLSVTLPNKYIFFKSPCIYYVYFVVLSLLAVPTSSYFACFAEKTTMWIPLMTEGSLKFRTTSFHQLKKKIDWLIWKAEQQCKRERDRESALPPTVSQSKMTTAGRAGPGPNCEPGALAESAMRWLGSQHWAITHCFSRHIGREQAWKWRSQTWNVTPTWMSASWVAA